MSFIFLPMNTEYANEIAYNWKYDGQYSFYDMTADEDDLAEFLDPKNWPGYYFAVLNDDSELIGFFTYSIEDGEMWIGLGLKPDLTGKGVGSEFVTKGIQFGTETLDFTQGCVMLSVASFNKRAIRAYEKAGFQVTEKYKQTTNNKEFEFTKMKKLLGGIKMEEQNLIGKCGLYCGACVIFRAERDNQTWRGRIAESYNCRTEQVSCNGCGSLSSDCWGNGCKIVLCTRAKGVSHCYECPEYADGGCEKFNDLYKDYLEAGVDLKENLLKIQQGKAEEWLQESKEKFTCKACGKPTAVWTEKCHHCGTEINGTRE